MGQSICNICGANYVYKNGRWLCPACGAYKQEELSNEEATLLYVADQKRRMADFDEAEKSYTDIIEKYSNNPYAYWGRLLCRHGIKYECDFDGQMIPTCCMPSKESVFTDKDCIRAIDYSDEETKRYFTHQAERIERIRKEWIDKASKEKPYDIFLCYKDSDIINGIERTSDSIVMQDLYIHLEKQGYRVFYSRESLRDKTGEKYEPYIFNALSTAKVMLVYGSKAEYITSTWLKNEWTRFQKLIKDGKKEKNALIVSYEGFTPNELPLSLSSMQCLDASRKTFFHDIDSEIKEVIGVSNNEQREIKSTRTKKVSNCALIEQERLAFNNFLTQLQEIESRRRTTKKPSVVTKLFSGVSDEIDESKANLIKTYRLPDTLEVLSEFMNHATSSIDFDTYNLLSQKANSSVNSSKKAVARAWAEKIEEAYDKAKLGFSGDEGFNQIEFAYKRTKKRIGRARIKFPALLIGCFAIPILICILVLTLIPGDNTDYSSTFEWQTNGLFAMLPEPDTNNGKITRETEKQIQFELYNITLDDFNDYVKSCREKGFTVDVTKNDDVFYAKTSEGYDLSFFYYDSTKVLKITLDSYDVESPPTQSGGNNDTSQNGNSTVDIDEFVTGFEKAEFDKYNSLASENGLGGAKIYIEGTLISTEILTASGTQSILGYIKDKTNNIWLIKMHVIPLVSSTHFDSVIGKEVVVKVVYDGYSRVKEMPSTTLDELLIIENGDIMFGMQKLLDEGNNNEQNGNDSNTNQDNSESENNSNTSQNLSWKNSSVDKTVLVEVSSNDYLELKEFAWFLEGDYLACIITIANKSNQYAIEFPTFRITGYSESGSIIGTEEQVLSVIYPNQDFTTYCLLFETNNKPNKIAIQLLNPYSYSIKNTTALDNPKHVQMYGKNVSIVSNNVTGEIYNANNYSVEMAMITVLFRNNDGDIIWGDHTFIHQVPAKGTIPFDIYIGTNASTSSTCEVLAYLW